MIKKFTDDRGDFVLFESDNCDQVNIVTNDKQYTFRGLHYQEGEWAQRKTVKIIQGEVLDFLYDPITKELKIYRLDKNSEPLVIERNYSHGYLTLKPNTIFAYAVQGEYNPDAERSIVYDTIPELKAIVKSFDPYAPCAISDKDKNGK